MQLGEKGQLGPQGLEDLPLVIFAFITGISAVMLLIDISSAQVGDSEKILFHASGKRLLESSKSYFQSDFSSAYGAIDEGRLKDVRNLGINISRQMGYLEYAMNISVFFSNRSYSFGDLPNGPFRQYVLPVSVVSSSRLYNGRIEAKIWKR